VAPAPPEQRHRLRAQHLPDAAEASSSILKKGAPMASLFFAFNAHE
jgi:hypothetical protein